MSLDDDPNLMVIPQFKWFISKEIAPEFDPIIFLASNYIDLKFILLD